MIDYMELSYYGPYNYALIEFCPGVNVIVGTSDSGKSIIPQAIKQVVENKPPGNTFISDFKKTKQLSFVNIGFSEGTTVSREKKKGVNQYIINGDEKNPYKALRDLPDEVNTITRMNELNIHSQHDPYFLLNKSGGKVAKEFNKLADLTIMDRVISISNEYIRSKTSEKKETESTVKELSKKLKKLRWIDKAKKELEVVQELEEEIDELKERGFLLEELQNRLYQIDLEINNQLNYAGAEEIINEILVIINEIRDLERKRHNLTTHEMRIKNAEETIKEKRVRGKTLQGEYNILLKKAKKCPFCGAKT